MQTYIKDIQHHQLFSGISENNLSAMLVCLGGYIKSYKKGEIIFLSEEPVKSVGIIITGRVNISKEYDNGDSTVLISIEEGELLGESFACGSFENSKVIFKAVSDSCVLFLPFKKVIHTCNMTCKFHHRLIENMVKLISNKNVKLMEKIEAASRKTLRDKIMTYLSNESLKQHSREFDIPLNRTELSEYLCADRSALTRELTTLKKEGIIDFTKNKFTLIS